MFQNRFFFQCFNKKWREEKQCASCTIFCSWLALAFGPSSCDFFPGKKHYVRIVYKLSTQQLTYHIRSYDDDLGYRSLNPNDVWEFKFYLDLDINFTCNMSYPNYHVHFDVFYNNMMAIKSQQWEKSTTGQQ